MGTLNVGRVGVDVTLSDPSRMSVRGFGRRNRSVTLSGWLTQTTVADRNAVERELLEHVGDVVAVTYSSDATHDGFYKVLGVNIDRDASLRPNSTTGAYGFSVDLELIGTHSSVEFLSNLTGVLATNDHGIDSGEAVFFHAPPVAGDDAYTVGGGVTATARTGEDGAIPVFLDLTLTNGLAAAKWGCSPSTYYQGAARIDVGGYTRAGKNAPMQPAYWVIGNGLIEMRGETYGGSSIGDLSIRAYNSTWGSWYSFDVVWNSTTDIPEWHYFNIIRNTPECVIVQLVRDADEAPPTDSRHTLTLNLRRGAPFVSCYYTYSSAVALTIDRSSADAATAITPTGATSAMAATDAADDGDGNRWYLAAADLSAVDTTNGGIDMASATGHAFAMGFVIGGASAATNDTADAISLQYLGQLNETVQAVRR